MSEIRNRQVLDVTHVYSMGSSFRLTVPKKVAKSMGLNREDNIVIFYIENDGVISIEKFQHS